MAIARPLEIDEAREDDHGRLTLTGELDIATVPRLHEAVEAMLGQGVKRLTIDLRPLSFLDSSGLREFIVLRDRAETGGWTLELYKPLPPALTIFEITRALENLPFVEEPLVNATSSLELELERSVHAPAVARSAVSERLVELGIDGSYGQTVVLLVSEIVSNAVRHSSGHSGSPILLSARVTPAAVRVAVRDGGEGFTPRPRDPEQLGDGYGLYLLEKAATNWGVEDAGGTTVWFELARG